MVSSASLLPRGDFPIHECEGTTHFEMCRFWGPVVHTESMWGVVQGGYALLLVLILNVRSCAKLWHSPRVGILLVTV